MNNNKEMGLLAQITRGLLNISKTSTATQLGDRTQYIGMSDIGGGVECLRKAVGNKVSVRNHIKTDDIASWLQHNDYDRISKTLSRQLILQRGHWFEDGIKNVLHTNTTNLFSQLAIEVEVNNIPIKAHLDFVLFAGGNNPTVRVLEMKSCNNIPKQLYTAYEVQLYGQIGLLSKYWDQPVFNLKSETGEQLFHNLTFPEIVQQSSNITLPDDISQVDLEGWVLALSMKNAQAFGPYSPSEIMTDLCINTAEQIWNYSKLVKSKSITLNELDYCEGFHPLCDYCDHSSDCPKFSKVKFQDESCSETLNYLDNLKEQKRSIAEEIETIENQLKDFYCKCNLHDEWIDVGEFSFRASESAPRKTLDKDALKLELTERLGSDEVTDLFNRHTKVGAVSTRLLIKASGNRL